MIKALLFAVVVVFSNIQAASIVPQSPVRGIGASYTANAVTFSGTQREARGAALSSVADGKKGIASFWFKRGASGGFEAVFYAASRFRIYFQSDLLQLEGYTTSAALTLKIVSGTITDSNWHHCLASWDMATAGSGKMYIDDVAMAAPSTFNNNDIWYSGASNWGVGDQPSGGVPYTGCLADVYFNTVENLDITSSSNRRLFISATGHPVDLGSTGATPTGNQPIVFMRGAFGGFNVNSGYGGNFTQTGTLTACTAP